MFSRLARLGGLVQASSPYCTDNTEQQIAYMKDEADDLENVKQEIKQKVSTT